MAIAPTTEEDIKMRIHTAHVTITPLMLSDVRNNIHKRIRKCSEVHGYHC